MRIHATAAGGFERGAADYERGRPGYPPEVVRALVDRLGIGADTTVVDLAAGTGKLTRLLVPTGATVVAVEPVAAMRARLLEAVVAGVEVLDGTAESIPLPDASVDAVTVAQAFHWFDAPAALTEIARVLRPGGGLAMVWNRQDVSVPWVARLEALVHAHDGGVPVYAGDTDWAGTVAATGLFTPLEHAGFRHDHEVDRDTLVARVLSTSYISAQPDDARAAMAEAVVALVETQPARFPHPYLTDLRWCRRR